jgi:hypothetical protein
MPTKPKIKASDAVRDIRSGITDSQLMKKYGLSPKGLQSLVLKLLEAKAITLAEINRWRGTYLDTAVIQQVDGRDMVNDIRSGMTDSELMQKYGLSAEGLGFAFQTLADSKVISLQELYGTSPSAHDTVFVETMRELPKGHLAMAVEVCQSKRPEIRGKLSRLTEKGFAITGMAAKTGDIITFVIPAGDFIEAAPVVLEALCRWVEREGDTGEWLAGFDITKISGNCLEDLRRLIQALPFLD